MRTTLGLPKRTRRELEIRERLKLAEEFRRRRQEADEDLDVFISYASADNNEAVQIRDAIVKAGGKVLWRRKISRLGKILKGFESHLGDLANYGYWLVR